MKKQFPTSECRAVGDLLVAYRFDELDSERKAQLRAHVDGCGFCASELEEISRALDLASSLKLTSPAADRYPEFVRRLVRETALGRSEAVSNLPSVVTESPQALPLTEGGLAAVIPIFGRRMAVRTGFNRGFDLTVQGRDGQQIMRLSASSLTKVVAAGAGVAFAAGVTVFAVFFALAPYFLNDGKKPVEGGSSPAAVESGKPSVKPLRGFRPPILAASAGDETFVLRQSENDIQAGFLRDGEEAQTFSLGPTAGVEARNSSPAPPPPVPFGLATNGNGFVAVADIGMTVYGWHVEPNATGFPTPTGLAANATHPSVCRFNDRYLAAWTAADAVAPTIQMTELDPLGRPVRSVPLTVAETVGGNKIGNPSPAGIGDRVLVSHVANGRTLAATFLRLAPDGNILEKREIPITAAAGIRVDRIKVTVSESGFQIFWLESTDSRDEIKAAFISNRGQLEHVSSLVSGPGRTPEFDARVVGNEIRLVRMERTDASVNLLFQSFDSKGNAKDAPRRLVPPDPSLLSMSFADEEGTNLVAVHFQGEGRIRLARISIGP